MTDGRLSGVALLLVTAAFGACTGEQRHRIKWTGRRTSAIAACKDGVGHKADPRQAEDACSCVFDRVSRRWDPDEFFEGSFEEEFERSGIQEACGASLAKLKRP